MWFLYFICCSFEVNFKTIFRFFHFALIFDWTVVKFMMPRSLFMFFSFVFTSLNRAPRYKSTEHTDSYWHNNHHKEFVKLTQIDGKFFSFSQTEFRFSFMSPFELGFFFIFKRYSDTDKFSIVVDEGKLAFNDENYYRLQACDRRLRSRRDQTQCHKLCEKKKKNSNVFFQSKFNAARSEPIVMWSSNKLTQIFIFSSLVWD